MTRENKRCRLTEHIRGGRLGRRVGLEEMDLRNLEARGGIEPPIKVLQTFALPLGDRAPFRKYRGNVNANDSTIPGGAIWGSGALDEGRV